MSDPGVLTCAVCGRAGARAFRIYEPKLIEWADGTSFWTERMIECAYRTTCRRRAYRSIPADVRARNREPLL